MRIDVRFVPRALGLASGVLVASFLVASPALPQTLPNGVAVGDVDPTSAVLWARSTAEGPFVFEVDVDETFSDPTVLVGEVADAAVPIKSVVTGLTPGTVYFVRATDAVASEAVATFRTPPPARRSTGMRFGVSGDSRGELAPFPAIGNVPERGLDLFVNLGDTMYADFPSPDLPIPQAMTLDEYRIKHNEVLSERAGRNFWAALRASTSILAMIDDHEVTNDFAGGAAPDSDPRFAGSDAEFINDTTLYENGLQAFQEYNPLRDEFYPADLPETRMAGERKLYRARTWGRDAAFFLLDARSFRDEELPPVADITDPQQIGLFLFQAFDPSRTMLGRTQLADLLEGLLAAHHSGVVWKFVLVPEPIQNLGVLAASDRFEGYAAERAVILDFIDRNSITNVVFIAADLHGTFINNLTYQRRPLGPQLTTGAFEVITGAVAFDAPLGPTVFQLAVAAGLVPVEQQELYGLLPPPAQDLFLEELINATILPLGLDPLGLEGSAIASERSVGGGPVAAHTYGWTEFDIDRETHALTVTTFGLAPYTEDDLASDAVEVANRRPQVVNAFTVTPKTTCVPRAGVLCLREGRFELRVDWRVGETSGRGFALPLPVGTEAGGFWYFDPTNLELVVKLIDGRELNGNHWLFLGSLSGVEFTVRVSDHQTGDTFIYTHSAGGPTAFLELESFPQRFAGIPLPGAVSPGLDGRSASLAYLELEDELPRVALAPEVPTRACAEGPGMCVGDRFRIEVLSADVAEVGSGAWTPATSWFWFGEASNPEVTVKILDGRAFNGHFWIYWTSLSDAGFTLRVTDDETGLSRSYEVAAGAPVSGADVTTF